MVIRTIDVHVGGSPVRLVIDGFPAPHGDSMAAKREWCSEHADDLRCVLMREPRGHRDMCGALFTEPVSAEAHAGLLCMDGDGFGGSSIGAAIGAVAIGLERRLLVPGGDGRRAILDTTAGPVTVERLDGVLDRDGVHARVTTAPAQILAGGVELNVVGRMIRADIVCAGEHVAIVDGESAGVPLDLVHVPELRRAGRAIAAAATAKIPLTHPLDDSRSGVDAVIFTSPAHRDLSVMRVVRVTRAGVVGRSPTGGGIAAVLTVLDAMGVADADPLSFEGLSGVSWLGRIVRRAVSDSQEIVAAIDATVWLTGEHSFVASADDPLSEGLSPD